VCLPTGTSAAGFAAGSQPAATKGEDLLIDVDVSPLEPQRLTLSQAQRECEDPACAVAGPRPGEEQALDLVDAERFDIVGVDARRTRSDGRVANDVTRTHGLVQGQGSELAFTTPNVIGIGPDVDPKVLTEISRMTFSDFYAAPSPAEMTSVLARALFDHECKDGRCV
jgi:hypothetical protein